MSTPNDGGPAFPVTSSTGDPRDGVYCHNGMTLRDWFAGQALAGVLSNQEFLVFLDKESPSVPTRHVAAAHAYGIADAMMKARAE